MVIGLVITLLIDLQKVTKTSLKNNSETNEKEILRERFIPPELRHKIINYQKKIKGRKSLII